MIDKIADQCGFEVPRVREPGRSRGPKRICQPKRETVLDPAAKLDLRTVLDPAAKLDLRTRVDQAVKVELRARMDPIVKENQQIKLVSAARIVQ